MVMESWKESEEGAVTGTASPLSGDNLLQTGRQEFSRSSRDMAATLRPRLRSAVWCAMLRMLDVVADFLSRGQWRDDLIDKWREAFRLLEATDKHLVSEYHLGHSHFVDGSVMTPGESWKSLSSDSETVGLLGPCEEKLSRGGTAYDVALIGKDGEFGSRDTMVVIPRPRLVSAAWCVALQMLEVVANFLLKGQWGDDLVDKWKEAFQSFEAIDVGCPHPLSKYHPGHSHLVDSPDERIRSLSHVSKPLGLLGPCETKFSRKTMGEAADTDKVELVDKEGEFDSRDIVVMPRLCITSAAWGVAVRMLDVVADFSLKGEWNADLIDKWKEAFQTLEAVGRGMPLQLGRSLASDIKAQRLLCPSDEKVSGRKSEGEAADRGGVIGKDEIDSVAVSESAMSDLPSPSSQSTTAPGQSGAASVCELVETPTNSDPVGVRGEAAESSVDSTVQQVEVLTLCDEEVQEMISPPVEHHSPSCSLLQKPSHGSSVQADANSNRGRGGNDGHTQSEQGWRCMYDAVMSLPQEKIIRSVVKAGECTSEWYRLGRELDYSEGQLREMTRSIPTLQGKLKAIIDTESNEHGERNAVEALLDACDKIMPLATVAVLEDLGIKYIGTVSDLLLFELGNEVGGDWKELAIGLGITVEDMDDIEMEVRTPKQQAWKMLRLWHSKKGRDFSMDGIHENLQQIRKNQETKQKQNIIFPENVHDDKRLCGRQRELQGIATTFWGQTTNRETPAEIPKCCLQVVNGMGGAGKSALVEKYAFLWQKMYTDGVFYFNAESLATLHISIKKNLLSLSLPSDGGSVLYDNEVFLQQIYSRGNALLLYDGADDLNMLEKVLPRDNAHVHVLVTTRISGDDLIFVRAHKVVSLERLGTNAGVEALQAWRGHIGKKLKGRERVFAKRVVSESPIEGLPLAIAHVATLMKRAGVNCEQYYRLFKDRQAQLQALALDMDKLLHYFRISNLSEPLMRQGLSKPNDLSRLGPEDVQSIAIETNDRRLLSLARHFIMTTEHVHLTWQLDIETVKEEDSNAMQVLLYASLMACRNIPERVLRPLVFGDVLAYQYRLSVSTLTSHTLVDVSESNEGCSLQFHPLVQSTVLERLLQQPEELHYRLSRMSQCLLNLLRHGSYDVKSYLRDDQFMSLIPHVYAVAEKAVWFCEDKTCDDLVEIACRVALESQHVDAAAYLSHKRLKASEVYAATEPERRYTALHGMGKACMLVTDPRSAQQHFMEALQLIERCSKREMWMERAYQTVLDELMRCYTAQEMFTEAESLHQLKLSLLNERPEDSTRDVGTALNDLALNYMQSGRPEEAIEVYRQLLEMLTRDRQTRPLDLSAALSNMGYCLVANGQHEKALPVLERCLSIIREHLPGDHMDVAKVLRLLSICYGRLGDVQRAMQLSEESVAIAHYSLPNNHPDTALHMDNLAECLQDVGRVDEAILLKQQCIEILRQNLPSTRYNLSTVMSNLGSVYIKKGMFNEAIRTLEECLAAERSFLTPHHLSIGMTLWNLGAAYHSGNNVSKATELWRECLSIREKSLSATHPDLIKVLQGLGVTTFKQGQYDESLQMRWRLHDILVTISLESEEMAQVCYGMAMCCGKLSQWDAAEEAFSKSLRIYTAMFPFGHEMIFDIQERQHKLWQQKFGHW